MVLDQLQSRGLIERRPHPHDRRRRLVFATATGRTSAERLGAYVRALEELIMNAALTPDERRQLNVLAGNLRRVLAGVVAPDARARPGPRPPGRAVRPPSTTCSVGASAQAAVVRTATSPWASSGSSTPAHKRRPGHRRRHSRWGALPYGSVTFEAQRPRNQRDDSFLHHVPGLDCGPPARLDYFRRPRWPLLLPSPDGGTSWPLIVQ